MYESGMGTINNTDILLNCISGLKFVQEIAAQSQTKLRIHLTDVNDVLYYREYMDFSLTTSLYVLNIGTASGTPLISMTIL
jgi:hypothetical protein